MAERLTVDQEVVGSTPISLPVFVSVFLSFSFKKTVLLVDSVIVLMSCFKRNSSAWISGFFLNMDGIQIYHCVYFFQQPRLPLTHYRHDFICGPADHTA